MDKGKAVPIRTPLLLLIALFLTRLPWLSQMLYDFDCIAFALGVERYDVSVFAPHPPGYPFYIGAGKLLNFLFHDPNRALAWVSLLASAVTVVLMYRLGRTLFSERTAVVGACLLLTSPLFWTYGEVAAPYAFSSLFSLLIAGFVLQALRGRQGRFALAAAATGLGSGFRPEILLVMSPLWLFFIRGLGWRKILTVLLAGAGSFLLWFLPTVFLSQGWGPYLAAVKLQSEAIWNQGIPVNLAKVIAYSLWGLGAGCLFLPFLFRGVSRLRSDRLFFFLWMLPYALLSVFVAFGQPGMLLVFLPPLILLLSNGLFPSREGAAEEPRDPGRTRAWLTAAVAVVVAGNVLLFAFAPFLSAKGFRDDDATFLDKVGTEFFLFTGRGIRTSDRYYGAVLSHIRENFSPADTLIFTNFKGWAYAQYYLREFRAHNYFCLFGLQGRNPYYIPEGTFPIPEGMNSLVLFNGEKHSIHFRDALEPYNRSEERTRVEHVFGDIELRVLDISGEETLHLEPDGFYLP